MNTNAQEIHHLANGCQALVLEALERHPEADLQAKGLAGYGSTLHLVWTMPGLSPFSQLEDYSSALQLYLCLARHAGWTQADNRPDDSGDCWRLMAKIRAGELRLVTNDTLAGLEVAA